MSTLTKRSSFIIAILFFVCSATFAQQTNTANETKNDPVMKTYLIEREIPDAGKLTPEQLKAISQTSCKVLAEMGPHIQWQQSYVTGNKIYCIYKAENEELIREHGKKGGFPVTSITEISSTISPATAR